MLTVVAFVVALAILIAVHEYGHYRVAVACGVKVLRFSIGFGKPLLRWQKKGADTEFVIGAIPLGGYVRMLDEREAPVAAEERHLAFNAQPLRSRAAIVAAGPLANLLLAVVLYACVNWMGVREPAAIVGAPPAASLLAQAGVQGGEKVVAMALEGEEQQPVRSLEDLRWFVAQAALNGKDVVLGVVPGVASGIAPRAGAAQREYRLPLSRLDAADADAKLLEKIGLTHPWTEAVLGDLEPGSAAEKSQLRKGDKVLAIDGVAVGDGGQLRSMIRASGKEQAPALQDWLVSREGAQIHVAVQLVQSEDGGARIGRLGAYIGAPVAMVNVRYGLWEGFAKGVQKTWEVSTLTLKMMGKMVIGQASLQNISGQLTIAEYAGKSAQIGLMQYIAFLALISVSLGVLNLLPLPVLDGGHLMYYLWEAITGKPPTTQWLERLQKGGVAVLLLMMCIAFFNDLSRLLG